MGYYLKTLIKSILGISPKKKPHITLREKLIKNGLTVGENFQMLAGCIIDYSYCWHITIGNNVILAPNVHILAHDTSTKQLIGYTQVKNVNIGNNVFVGAGSIIMPGVTIEDNVIIGAGSIVTKTLKSNGVYAGNPARFITNIATYTKKAEGLMTKDNIFDYTYTLEQNITGDMKNQIMKSIKDEGVVFIQ